MTSFLVLEALFGVHASNDDETSLLMTTVYCL